jgi:hypothetical protein
MCVLFVTFQSRSLRLASNRGVRNYLGRDASMIAMRLAVTCVCGTALMLIVGIAPAGASSPTRVLKFYDTAGVFTPVGWNPSSNAPPPIGAENITTLRLQNVGTQFGKPKGTTVGRVLITCTVMAVDTTRQTIDGNCFGIAHVPDGFFTFEGNGALGNQRITYYAITGGVGPYANARGQIKVVGHADGSSSSTVMLWS